MCSHAKVAKAAKGRRWMSALQGTTYGSLLNGTAAALEDLLVLEGVGVAHRGKRP
jgi:hypothetical protein